MSLSAGPVGILPEMAEKRAVLPWMGDSAPCSDVFRPRLRVPTPEGGFAGQAEYALGIVVVGPRFLVA